MYILRGEAVNLAITVHIICFKYSLGINWELIFSNQNHVYNATNSRYSLVITVQKVKTYAITLANSHYLCQTVTVHLTISRILANQFCSQHDMFFSFQDK